MTVLERGRRLQGVVKLWHKSEHHRVVALDDAPGLRHDGQEFVCVFRLAGLFHVGALRVRVAP
eukprot:1232403-Alexandrium_andersonii.AAC.1